MRRNTVARAIRRAVALHLSALAPVLVACGHMGVTSGGGEAGSESSTDAAGGGDSGSSDATTENVSDDGPSDAVAEGDGFICYLPDVAPCTVVPDAEQYCGGSCTEFCSPFNGTAEQCGAGPDGGLSFAQCVKYCPSPMDAQSCSIYFNGPCQFGTIDCVYGCSAGRKPAGLRARRSRE